MGQVNIRHFFALASQVLQHDRIMSCSRFFVHEMSDFVTTYTVNLIMKLLKTTSSFALCKDEAFSLRPCLHVEETNYYTS